MNVDILLFLIETGMVVVELPNNSYRELRKMLVTAAMIVKVA